MAMIHLATLPLATAPQVEWSQSAFSASGKHDLLKRMAPLSLEKLAGGPPKDKALIIDRSKKFQKIHGFGGAFTEAAALNWRSLTAKDQKAVIQAYFSAPKDGGLGYTVGRVPINSCDFGPGSVTRTYSFDDVEDDVSLEHFDDTVQHDVDSGMIPMVQAAKEAIEKAGGELLLFASPWSPPAWMKLPVGGVRSMLLTAKPNGLDPEYQRPYAKYFSRFISAYKKHGIDMWGVTIQNEAEAADVGWEKCVYTPEYMAQFVKNHLGPVLHKEQPGVKIIGFDHNKDHVHTWAKGLYADPEAKKYFDGIGVHWYGGLNTGNLDNTHLIAPDKFILATEACNCPGVIYQERQFEWWQRAEHLGMDILEDLLHWCTGWVDWNLILDITGGPNHLGNRCDANIIADPDNVKGYGTLVFQASYYYMGHFSRYLPFGSQRVGIANTVVEEKELSAEDVADGQPLVFLPCSGSELQSWTLDEYGSLFVEKTQYECADISLWGKGPRIDTYQCVHSTNQIWERRIVPSCSAEDVAAYGIPCTQLVNPSSNLCLTKAKASGAAVGLDAGTTMEVAQALPCKEIGDPSQTFDVVRGDQGGFPNAFPIRSPPVMDDDDEANDRELCLQPYIAKEPEFDAIAFETPDGAVSVVAINKGEEAYTFSLYDESLGLGATKIESPPHSIQSFVIPASTDSAAAAAFVEGSYRLFAESEEARSVPPSAPTPSLQLVGGVMIALMLGAVAGFSRRDAVTRYFGLSSMAEGLMTAEDEDERPYVAH